MLLRRFCQCEKLQAGYKTAKIVYTLTWLSLYNYKIMSPNTQNKNNRTANWLKLVKLDKQQACLIV